MRRDANPRCSTVFQPACRSHFKGLSNYMWWEGKTSAMFGVDLGEEGVRCFLMLIWRFPCLCPVQICSVCIWKRLIHQVIKIHLTSKFLSETCGAHLQRHLSKPHREHYIPSFISLLFSALGPRCIVLATGVTPAKVPRW